MIIPNVFVGGNSPEPFLSWVENIENFIENNQVPSWEKLRLAISLLRGEAKVWWRAEEEARWYDEEPIYTWEELKEIMGSKYVPNSQWEETEFDFDLGESNLPYPSQEVPLPTFSAEKEGETQVLCIHVPDQTKRKEEVLGDSSTAAELVYALVDQGESVKTLTCESLIRPLPYFQFNCVEYLRAVRGLQQVVFEPGGILCVFEGSNNIMGQNTASIKLNLGDLFSVGDQDGWRDLFKRKVISFSDKRGDLVSNMFFTSSITDQSMMGRAKHDLDVVKESPKLKNECGNLGTRPPNHMELSCQFMRRYGQGKHADTSKIFLRQEEGLQCLVFDPGETQEEGLQCFVFDPGKIH